MTDGRILEWLDVTEKAVSADSEQRVEVILAAFERREELRSSMLESPPTAGPDAETARRLRKAEDALLETATQEQARVSEALEKVRAQKESTKRYRPARSSDAVFVSRKA
jgi:hypothetical protein